MLTLIGWLWSATVAPAAPESPPAPPAPTIQVRSARTWGATVRLTTPRWGVAALELDHVGEAMAPVVEALDACRTELRGERDLDATVTFTVTRSLQVEHLALMDGVDGGAANDCVLAAFEGLAPTSRPFFDLPVVAHVALLGAREGAPITVPREGLRSSLDRAYHDEAILLGVVAAPAAAAEAGEGGPGPVALLARFRIVRGARHQHPLVWGITTDVRGFRTLATHTAVVGGVHLLPRQATRIALTSGLGLSQRGVFPTTEARFWVPLRGSVRWFAPGGAFEILARGGGNLGAGPEGELVVDPEVVVGVTVQAMVESTSSITVFRLELGGRRELGAPTFTAAVGLSF